METLYSCRKEPHKEMAMYAVAITPLIRSLEDQETKQVWFADDATAGGCPTGLRKWWDLSVERGPAYGYYPNPAKTCLVVKEECTEMPVPWNTSLAISVHSSLTTKQILAMYILYQ